MEEAFVSKSNQDDLKGLYDRIQENQADIAPQLIYSDLLEELGRMGESLHWRGEKCQVRELYEMYRTWAGDGIRGGFGEGDVGGFGTGNGFGQGCGVIMRAEIESGPEGSGNGCLYGNGDGSGCGYGDGVWHGSGNENGVGDKRGDAYDCIQLESNWTKEHEIIFKGKPMIGEQVLIWCGSGFAWVGHVDEMYAPGCYKLSNAGMLCRTGSESWMSIAANRNRSTYVYRHAPDGIVFTGAEVHGAVLWKGDLPGEDVG